MDWNRQSTGGREVAGGGGSQLLFRWNLREAARRNSFVIVSQPDTRHPLRFTFQTIDFGHQLRVGPLLVTVDDDHIEVMAVHFLHLACLFDDFLQFVVLFNKENNNQSPRTVVGCSCSDCAPSSHSIFNYSLQQFSFCLQTSNKSSARRRSMG